MMKATGNDDEDDIESMSPSSSLLHQKKDVIEMPEIPFCGCLSVRYYQPYFDIDTIDIFNRLSSALFYCRREQTFLASFSDKPDAYGPFWISTSLIFTVAVVSHINSYFMSWLSGKTWEYDFKSVVTACSIVYGFATIVPGIVWLILRQYDGNIKLVTLVCVYGYSLFVFIPATAICAYPSNLLAWLSFLGAGILSTHFMLKNVGPILVSNMKQEAMIFVIALGTVQILLSLTLKLTFFYE